MSLDPSVAEGILRDRLGAPINPVPTGPQAGKDNDKVLGFAAANGRVLALNREISAATRIWFEPPEPSAIEGISPGPQSTINSNLSGRRVILNRGCYVKADGTVKPRVVWDEAEQRHLRAWLDAL